MYPKALLVRAENVSGEDQRLAELLDFFGIPWQALTAGEICRDFSLSNTMSGFCVLSSAQCFAEALGNSQDSDFQMPGWLKGAGSVFLYGFQDTLPCKQLLRLIGRDERAEIRHTDEQQIAVSITNDFSEMCGPMSGMQLFAEPGEGDVLLDVTRDGEPFQSIIQANAGELFLSITTEGTRFYLSGGSTVTDIHSSQSKYFDVRKHFFSAVPVVMYLKWAFRGLCWSSPAETGGCLIIDDPPLKPRYGFLEYSAALGLMDQHNFSTAIAFIPWNWQRTNPHTVEMFRNRPDRLSLCVHGSDHMGSEFATRSTAQLGRSLTAAKQRMELLRERTSLPHARIMVFPRGAFSPEAGQALKLNGFIAAVNTEVAPEHAENKTIISDLWSMAIMKYGTFPIFTRRYLSHGIENFAFDGLLGKPCLIVGHHEAFRGGGRELVDFIDKLNALTWKLRWRSLGEVVTRSFNVRIQADGASVIQVFAKNLVIENSSAEPRELTFLKEEEDADCVQAVTVNGRAIDFSCDGKFLCWSITLPRGGVTDASVTYFDRAEVSPGADTVGYRVRTRARRYLSEFRDNYLYQSNFIFESAAKIRRFLK